jgi:predicted transcriptional regulator
MLKKIKGDIELIGRHLEVLSTVAGHQPIGIIKLSEILKCPQHRIRYSLRVLEGLGYIRASPTGAVATGKANELFSNLDADIDEIIALFRGMKSLTWHDGE